MSVEGPLNHSSSVSLIGLDNFEDKFLKERTPILLLCMPRSVDSAVQISVLESMQEIFGGKLRVFILKDEFLTAFRERFTIRGTPTFLIFVEGSEIGRMCGLTDQDTLKDFILQTLPFLRADH